MNFDDLDPGIRLTVRWLRDHAFETTDSGDGVTKLDSGMEHVLPEPHVFMVVRPTFLIGQAIRLYRLLETRGVAVRPGMVQATYDPADESGIIQLVGVNDDMLVTADAAPATKAASRGDNR